MLPPTIQTPPARPAMPGAGGMNPAAAGAGGMDPMMMMQIMGALAPSDQGPMPPATYPSPPMSMNPAFTQMALQALMGGSQAAPQPNLGALLAGR